MGTPEGEEKKKKGDYEKIAKTRIKRCNLRTHKDCCVELWEPEVEKRRHRVC